MSNQQKNIFQLILEGEKVNNEIVVGIANDLEIIKEQNRLILTALYPATAEDESADNTEPTALGSEAE